MELRCIVEHTLKHANLPRIFLAFLFCYALETSPLAGGGLEYQTNRAGSDFRNFELDTGASACSAACAADPRCRAFTWVRPGVQGTRARWWLKDATPVATANPDCISGAMAMQNVGLSGSPAAAGAWGVWAYQLGADGTAWRPCDIQYVAARRPARYDGAANYRLVRNADTRAAADQYVSLFSRYYDDQPDFVVKMRPCKPRHACVRPAARGRPWHWARMNAMWAQAEDGKGEVQFAEGSQVRVVNESEPRENVPSP